MTLSLSSHRAAERASLLIVAFFAVLSCATTPACGSEDDPWEGFNRAIFRFNDTLDHYILRPVARGWIFITPQFARTGLDNFAANLRFPIVFVNDVLQWKWRRAGEETGRFAVNSTIGVLGFVDVARRWGLERQLEDSGQTLAVWGIPSGPYLVLPLLGPSNPRDTVGFAADSALAIYPFFVGTYTYITTGYAALNVVNQRALADEDLESAREAALDFYVFVRDAYRQRREALIRDEAGFDEDRQADLYDVPDEDDLYDVPDDSEDADEEP
jgi:phospholipid-binding lipoprotein MlaA